MKNLRIVVLGTAALGIAFSGTPRAGEGKIAAEPPEVEEIEEPAEPMPQFSGEQLRRLDKLRAWLARRRLEWERHDGADPAHSPPGIAEYGDRQLLTPLGQRYAGGFRSRGNGPNRENPTLHIGRSPDGRIHHRYIFGGSEEAEPASPRSGYSPAGQTDQRHPRAGAGVGQSMVRMWPPEPADQRIAPRLDYELPDQRR